MKKLFLPVCFILLFAGLSAHAQNPQALKKVMELKMPRTADDDMPGTRGASVAWHPTLKKYYAAFAGNQGYPLALFDEKGKRLSNEELSCMIDIRGLWFNPTTKTISGNAYSSLGWFSYVLDKNGIPTEIKITMDDAMHQPTEQCVGVYNTINKQVLFLHGSQVYKYNAAGEPVDSVLIHWNRKKADGPADDEDPSEQPEDYNYTSLIYTGVAGQELGFLNVTNKQVDLYDLKTGFLTKMLALPETAVTEESFNFTYANKIYWLFDMEDRKWVGYK